MVTIREPIDGELVSLTPLSIQGADDWVRWMEDPDTTRYLYAPGDEPKQPFTLTVALDWGRRMLADPRRIVFGLRERSTGRPIGDARLTPIAGRRAKFSIMIGERDARGRGMGTEATRLACRYGFETMGLREIELDVHPGNTPAIKAYLAVGFEHSRGTTMRLRRPVAEQPRAAVGE